MDRPERPIIRLDITSLRQIIVASVNKISPDLDKYIEQCIQEQINDWELSEYIKNQVLETVRQEIATFFYNGGGRVEVRKALAKAFSQPEGE